MTSYRISVSPSRRAASRFVAQVRRLLLSTLAEERKNGITQSSIARDIGVHRSVINRELQGISDISLGRVAELAVAMGRTPVLAWKEPSGSLGHNSDVRSFTIEPAPAMVMGSTDLDAALRISASPVTRDLEIA